MKPPSDHQPSDVDKVKGSETERDDILNYYKVLTDKDGDFIIYKDCEGNKDLQSGSSGFESDNIALDSLESGSVVSSVLPNSAPRRQSV